MGRHPCYRTGTRDARSQALGGGDDAIVVAMARSSNNGDGAVPPQPFNFVRSCHSPSRAQGACARPDKERRRGVATLRRGGETQDQPHNRPVPDPLYFFNSLLQRTGNLEKQSSVTRDIRSVDLQSRRAGAPTLRKPRPQPRTDLRRQVAEKVSAGSVHPYFWRFLIWRIGDQVKGITGFECSQMAVPIREGEAVDRSSEVRWSTIRKGRTTPPHSGFSVRVTVHCPRFIRYVVQLRRSFDSRKYRARI